MNSETLSPACPMMARRVPRFISPPCMGTVTWRRGSAACTKRAWLPEVLVGFLERPDQLAGGDRGQPLIHAASVTVTFLIRGGLPRGCPPRAPHDLRARAGSRPRPP